MTKEGPDPGELDEKSQGKESLIVCGGKRVVASKKKRQGVTRGGTDRKEIKRPYTDEYTEREI